MSYNMISRSQTNIKRLPTRTRPKGQSTREGARYEARTHLWRVGYERGDGDDDPRHTSKYSANGRNVCIPQVPVYGNPDLPNLARR